jgi:hypothetical protein
MVSFKLDFDITLNKGDESSFFPPKSPIRKEGELGERLTPKHYLTSNSN